MTGPAVPASGPDLGDESGPGRPSCSVWWATPREDAALVELLDEAERRRAARLARPADRRRYVTAHALVRVLLADRVGLPATALRFDRTCGGCGSVHHGKPRLADDISLRTGAVPFSLARSADRVAVAVADTATPEVGVDVERVPDSGAAVLAAASEVLTGAELATYRGLDASRRGHALALWWARKESVLKATGHGLAVAPSTLAVTPPGEAPAVTGWEAATAAGRARSDAMRPRSRRPQVAMRDLDAPRGYVGCVAAVGGASIEVAEHDADSLLAR